MASHEMNIEDARRLVSALTSAQGADQLYQNMLLANRGNPTNDRSHMFVYAAEAAEKELGRVYRTLDAIVSGMVSRAIEEHEEKRHG